MLARVCACVRVCVCTHTRVRAHTYASKRASLAYARIGTCTRASVRRSRAFAPSGFRWAEAKRRGKVLTCVFIRPEAKFLHACLYSKSINLNVPKRRSGAFVFIQFVDTIRINTHTSLLYARDLYRAHVSTLFLIAPTHMCDPFGITQSHAYAINYARPRVIRGIYTLRVYSSRRFIPRRGIKISLGFSVPGPLKGARDFESSPW